MPIKYRKFMSIIPIIIETCRRRVPYAYPNHYSAFTIVRISLGKEVSYVCGLEGLLRVVHSQSNQDLSKRVFNSSTRGQLGYTCKVCVEMA